MPVLLGASVSQTRKEGRRREELRTYVAGPADVGIVPLNQVVGATDRREFLGVHPVTLGKSLVWGGGTDVQ